MIASVCLNPAIDRTVTLPALIKGGLNRVENVVSEACGKGVNVALAAHRARARRRERGDRAGEFSPGHSHYVPLTHTSTSFQTTARWV